MDLGWIAAYALKLTLVIGDAHDASVLDGAIAELGGGSRSTPVERFMSAYGVVKAARENGLPLELVAAIAWHESGFNPKISSKTDDHGLMQVHWQNIPILAGLVRADLLDPIIGSAVGAHELAYWRSRCKHIDHQFWGHYKWGNIVKDPKYGDRVEWRRRKIERTITRRSPAA